MRTRSRAALTAALFLVSLTPTAPAQQAGGLVADLLVDIGQVEEKLLGLAKLMPESTFGWRPAQGVRASADVFLHISAENYFLPAAMKVPAPEGTGIKGDDYKTVQAYEGRQTSREQVIADLETSFAHLKTALQRTTDAQLREPVSVFGMTFTGQQFLILITTHLHEHLGQLIAYARANGIKPPWSN